MANYQFRNLVFQGGGVKAFAYHGALRVLDSEGITPQIERVAGSSAGGFLSTLLSLRLDYDEIIEVYRAFDTDRLLVSRSGEIPDSRSTPTFLQRELSRIQSNFASVSRLITKFGWYRVDLVYDWMQTILAKYCFGDRKATFAQFRDWGFRDLYIVVTNMTTHRTEIFSFDTTPDVAVVDALLMTQAVPFFFEGLRFDGENFGKGDHYGDGGILLNYPIQIFDEEPFAKDNRWYVNGVNWETLGCRLYTPPDCPKRSGEITNLLTYMQNAFEGLLEAQAVAYELSKSDRQRTININDCCVRAIDTDVQPQPGNKRYESLVAAGEEAVVKYLESYRPPIIKPFYYYLDRTWQKIRGKLDE